MLLKKNKSVSVRLRGYCQSKASPSSCYCCFKNPSPSWLSSTTEQKNMKKRPKASLDCLASQVSPGKTEAKTRAMHMKGKMQSCE